MSGPVDIRRRFPRLLAELGVWLALGPAVACAQLPGPRLSAFFPPGAQQGTQVELTLSSIADLEGARALRCSHPGITAVAKTQTVEGQSEQQPVPNVFLVTVATDVSPGTYELSATGTYGPSTSRLFQVGDRPETREVEPNGSRMEATAVSTGTVVNGVSGEARDIDWFKFAASAGQRIVLDVWATRIDSQMDATLELYDSGGRLLRLSRDHNRREPLIDFTVPADGEYFVRLFDFSFGGGPQYVYRLGLVTAPHIEFADPPSLVPGTRASVTLFGRNLPGGSPTDGITCDGQLLDQVTVEIDVPALAALDPATAWDGTMYPAAAALDMFSYRLASPQGVSNPVLLGLASAPVVREQEPNDDPAAAPVVQPPVELAGRFQVPGDHDWFEFDATKDQVLHVEVISQRLGLPTNPYVTLQQLVPGAEGQVEVRTLHELGLDPGGNVGPLSFDTTTDDPTLRFVAPETARYRLLVRNLFAESRGEARYAYRLVLRPEQPDFRVAAVTEFPNAPETPQPWPWLLGKGGTCRLTLVALRLDGFVGEIRVTPDGLTPGVHAAEGGTTIGPGQNRGTLVLWADEQAADYAGRVSLTARAMVDGSERSQPVRPATVVWPGPANLPSVTRRSRELSLGVAGVEPFFVQAGLTTATLPQSHQLTIPMSVVRRGEFQGPLTLTASGIPDKTVNESITINADQTAGQLRLYFPSDAPPGRYTLFAQVTGQVSFTKSPEGKDKQNLNVVAASTPWDIEIVAGPLVLAPQVPNNGVLKPGGTLEIPVTLTRRLEFAGPVTLELLLPPEAQGLTASPVTVAADQTQGTLVIQAAADAPAATISHAAVLARLAGPNGEVVLHQPIPVQIQP